MYVDTDYQIFEWVEIAEKNDISFQRRLTRKDLHCA